METLKAFAQRLLAAARAYYKREPVRVNNAITAAVVAVLATVGITVGFPGGLVFVAAIVPVLLGTKASRDKVYSPETVERIKKRARAAGKRAKK